jgi:multidrug efflux pump subunit AcrA (membrane-fusion protein)
MSDKKHSPTGRRRTLLITWGITTALLVLTVLLVAKVALTAPPQPKELPKRLADVEVITVQPREYEETLVLPGRLEALSRKDIGSELAGRLETWLVSEGEAVEAGQEIARLNTDLLRAQRTTLETAREGAGIRAEAAETVLRTAEVALEQARTRLIAQRLQEEVAESALELAQSEFDRASALADEDIASRAELDAARHALNTALVGVRSAAEAVSEAQLAVDAAGRRLRLRSGRWRVPWRSFR